MESISRYIQLIFYTWKWVNYTEWDGVHFQVYLFSFSIPGNEWTTLNEMECISRYIYSHFLYLEMSELHWMRWRAFPGISFSFSIHGNEWTALNEMESISRYIQLIFYTWKWCELHWMRWRAFPGISILIFCTWKWVNYTEWDGQHFQVYHNSFSMLGNEWTTLNEMESISRYIITHFLYLEMSELHWMRWSAFPGISNSFSIPGNEWTTLNEMESISRYIQFIFYIWKWVTCTEWDGKHFQVYLTHFLYLEMSELHWMRWTV